MAVPNDDLALSDARRACELGGGAEALRARGIVRRQRERVVARPRRHAHAVVAEVRDDVRVIARPLERERPEVAHPDVVEAELGEHDVALGRVHGLELVGELLVVFVPDVEAAPDVLAVFLGRLDRGAIDGSTSNPTW